MPGRAKKSDSNHEIGKRWTPSLAARGFAPIVQPFLEHQSELQITPTEAMLIVHLMSFKWDTAAPFPAMSKLASRLGISERYVRKLCSRLEKFGYLKRYGRLGTSNQFDLNGLFAELEKREAARAKVVPLAEAS